MRLPRDARAAKAPEGASDSRESGSGRRASVLIISDDVASQNRLVEQLADRYDVRCTTGLEPVAEYLRTRTFSCILIDLGTPGADEPLLLGRLRAQAPRTAIVLLPSLDGAREELALVEQSTGQKGEPHQGSHLNSRGRPDSPDAAVSFDAIIARSPAMRDVVVLARRLAESESRVLITGETGTGKDLLARAIHSSGPRRNKPFVAVNCAAVPETLAESEFFGHEKGAFTGASRTKPGWFELAHAGTLFLDEVTCLPEAVQLKLLRVLQDGVVTRVGGESRLRVDVRVITATNRDVRAEVTEGRFREDLFYRLKVGMIRVPPLRERREDVPDLLHHFLRVFNTQFRRDIRGYAPAALELLCRYDWPGNIRELEHAVEFLVIMEHGNLITTQHVSSDILAAGPERPARPPARLPAGSLKEAREDFERQLVLEALVRARWNQTRAADLLGLSRSRLIAKMKKYAIRAED